MIVFDTETTGFTKPVFEDLREQPDIIELGAIKTDENFNIIDKYSQLFRIASPLTEEIINITNITDEMLKNKPTFSDCADDIFNFFKGETIWIGHNIPFDRDILLYNLMKIDKHLDFPWSDRLICTIQESLFLKGYRLKLATLHELATGKNFKGAHRAIVDAEATLKCAKWLREEHGAF